MKENGSMAGKMLNGNWVSKRKRRKLPSGIGKSNGKEINFKTLETPSSTSSMHRLKNENMSGHSSSKVKGNDGVSSSLFFIALYRLLVENAWENLVKCKRENATDLKETHAKLDMAFLLVWCTISL